MKKYTPYLISFLILFSGVLNILSAFRHMRSAIFLDLNSIYGLPLATASRIGSVIIGILLVSTARGLVNRNRDAWRIAIVLTFFSIFFHLLREFGPISIITGIVIIVLLLWNRKAFPFKSKIFLKIDALKDLAIYLALFIFYYIAGLVAFDEKFAQKITIKKAISNFIYEITGLAQNSLTSTNRQAVRFEESLWLIFIFIAFIFLIQLFNNYVLVEKSVDPLNALELIKRFGHDSLSYFATNSKKSHFFSSRKDAFIPYALSNNIILASGDPIGPEREKKEIIKDFKESWDKKGFSTAFMSASKELLPIYRELGYKTMKIGEEAIVDVQKFDLEKDYPGKTGWKFRRAVRHVAELGIEFKVFSMRDLPSLYYSEIVELNDSWLAEFGKGGVERGFSQTLSRLPNSLDIDCQIVCAVQKQQISANVAIDKLIGFMVFVPIYNGNGFSLDVMRRIKEAPNGLNEFMIVKYLEYLKARGYKKLSLNFAPFAETSGEKNRLLNALKDLIPKNVSAFLYLDSLYFFNNKFHPEWKSRYLTFESLTDMPKIVMAIADLEGSVELDLNLGKRIIDVFKVWKKMS